MEFETIKGDVVDIKIPILNYGTLVKMNALRNAKREMECSDILLEKIEEENFGKIDVDFIKDNFDVATVTRLFEAMFSKSIPDEFQEDPLKKKVHQAEDTIKNWERLIHNDRNN